jgi:hypothetical protein
MGVTCKVLAVVASAATVVVMGAGPGAGAGGPAAREADLAHHGQVSLWSGQLGVRLESENHGPSALPDATVRLDFSVPLATGRALPPSCLWSGDRVVLCRTGQLRPIGRSAEVALDLRTDGVPDEVVVQIDTAWNGGASDPSPANHQHRVLTPSTGELYAF